MKSVTYIGPHSEGVEIAATGQVVAKGESVDVPDEIAEGLLEQSDAWASLPATTKPSKADTTKEAAT